MIAERGTSCSLDVYKEIESIKDRVGKLEAEMVDVKSHMATVKDNTDAILDVITATKPWLERAKKILPPLITFIVGAGYLNPQLGHILTQIF